MPSDDVSTESQEENAYAGRDLEAMSFARNYHRWIIDEFQPYLSGSIAEVGAGTGDVSALLLECPNVRVTAFEPSSKMYTLLANRFPQETRIRLRNTFFDGQPDEVGKGFDSVAYINVLEHIENDRNELAKAWQAIRPGGHLLIFVPALHYLYSQFDQRIGHHRRYHLRELEALVEAANFKIVFSKYFDILGVLPWYIAYVLLRRSLNAGSVALYDRLAVPIMRVIEGWFSPPFGKNLLLVATKPVA